MRKKLAYNINYKYKKIYKIGKLRRGCRKLYCILSKTAITRVQTVIIAGIIILAAIGGVYYYTLITARPRITVAWFGGIYNDALNLLVPSFEEEFGVDVEIYLQTSSAETTQKILAEKESPTIDVLYGGAYDGEMLRRNDMATLFTEEDVPNLQYIRADAKYKEGNKFFEVGFQYWPFSWVIYSDAIPEEIAFNQTVEWFLDARLKDRFSMPSVTWAACAEWFLAASGDYYNTTAGFELMKKMAPNLRFIYTAYGDLNAPFQGKELYGALMGIGEAKELVDAGIPIVPVKMYPIATVHDSLVIVKGGKEDYAKKFVNYILDPENLAQMSYYMSHSPTLIDPPSPPSEIEPYILSPDELDTLAAFEDPVYVADNWNEWMDIFDRDVVPLI